MFFSSVIFYIFPFLYVGRGIFALAAGLSITGLVIVRIVYYHLSSASALKRRILVVGTGDACTELIDYINGPKASRTMQFAGLYTTPEEIRAGDSFREIPQGNLLRAIESTSASDVVVATRERRGGVLPLHDLLDCKLRGIRVFDNVSFFEMEDGVLKLDDLRASWMIFGPGFGHGLTRDVIKRMFDITASSVLLVLSLPLMCLAALAIWIESNGPVIYRQERIGEAGKPFEILKFRSMIQNAEQPNQPQWALPDDTRITRVGRVIRFTRIDELPQLFNVLVGEMSFVGPRPERPYFVKKLATQIKYYDMRHSLKPGITGWSQVRFHYGGTIEGAISKLQYDLYYVKNHSMFLDLMIIVETIQVVLLCKGER